MQTPLINQNSAPVPASDADEIEIDLRKYITIVTSRWRLVLTSTLIAAILGGIFSQVSPSPYEAVSTVAIVKTSTQVEFDPKIKTVTQDELTNTTADARRATYVGLAQNATIADRVIAQIGDQLTTEEKNPARLMDKVDATASPRGDLILIKVRDRDPQKAASIASAWALEYERYVNALYSGAPADYSTSVSNEYQRAVDSYTKSQTAFEDYIKSSKIESLQRTISGTKQLLDALQVGKQNALTVVISEQLKVNSEIISAYLGAQSANRLVAFEKEQEGRRKLIEAYLDAKNNSQIRVFSEQVTADLQLLRSLYSTQTRVRQLIGDATAMREQVQNGGDAAAQSNSTAISLLKTQAFAFTVPISGSVQLNLPSSSAAVTAVAQADDLGSLITSLQARDKALTEQITTLSDRLLTGEGYRLDVSDGDTSKLVETISSTYALLFDMGTIGRLSEAVPVTNPLTLAAQQKASESLSLSSSDLSAALLANNSESDSAMQGLQARLTDAQAQLEREQAIYDQLKRDRDLRQDTVETLARKQAEVNLASAIAGSEVRVAAAALPPERRVTSAAMIVLVAGVVGLALGILLSFLAHVAIGNDPKRITWPGTLGRAARWILLPQ